ncbi:MAG: hypothetical protein WBB19_14875 [Desulforhopalus sp.]
MQKFVEELKQLLPFKDTTDIGDIVLIVSKEPQMLIYAHVDDIERDTSRRDEWWHIHLSMLSIPLQKLTWTLRSDQMTGKEIFTMGGEERFVKAVEFRDKADSIKPETAKSKKKISTLKRVK